MTMMGGDASISIQTTGFESWAPWVIVRVTPTLRAFAVRVPRLSKVAVFRRGDSWRRNIQLSTSFTQIRVIPLWPVKQTHIAQLALECHH